MAGRIQLGLSDRGLAAATVPTLLAWTVTPEGSLGRRNLYYSSKVRLSVADAALKHGCCIEDISHAIDMAMFETEIEPDSDPPKILFIGPDPAGNLLELIGGEMDDDFLRIWHAKPCRKKYLKLLPKSGGAL